MEHLPEVQEQRLVIAIDYGTTFTGIAIATPAGDRAILDEIDVVDDWGPGMGNSQKIPSVISYSLKTRNLERQWGSNLSPEAIAMVHTKLQLDVDDTSTELDLILQELEGMHNLSFQYIEEAEGRPKFTRKGPEEIVEDYLCKVFDYLLEMHDRFAVFAEELRNTIPVDIVVTIPAEWGYRAKNSTFRALTRAGFNTETFPQLRDMILVSEPEAAAIYSSRILMERNGSRFFRKGECFVLCDAGGGTADVVSYRVTQVNPTFELERATLPTGAKCGSIFINLAFKQWLRDLIGPQNYNILDQTEMAHNITSHDSEGERMRELMKRFDIKKRAFRRNHRDMKLDLPEPYNNLNLDTRVVGGQITITCADMESFFEPRVDTIVKLIDGQVQQVEDLQIRLKNVLLVGGFAESQYLQESLRESIETRDCELHIPDTSWTAVVRGAAIFGIEKARKEKLSSMAACPRSYGVTINQPFSVIGCDQRDLVTDTLTKKPMAASQLKWLIKKGDLVLSDEPKAPRAPLTINFTADSPRLVAIPIYAYDGDQLPDRLSNSKNELVEFHVIHHDLRSFPLTDFKRCQPTPTSVPYYVAPLELKLMLAPNMLHVDLYFKDQHIYTRDLPDGPPSYDG